MNDSYRSISEKIKSKATELGFRLCGIALADPPGDAEHLREWLDRGYAGEMAYLQRTASVRQNLKSRFTWAKTVICVAAVYHPDKPERGFGKYVARYAQGKDYHDVLDAPLAELERCIQEQAFELGATARTRRYIDTGPVLERQYAAAAGIGWIGKNTLLLNETIGSYFFLAEIITDLPLPVDDPVSDRCGTCTRCLDACPTQAFMGPGILNATRCISYLTIETKSPIPAEPAQHLGDNLYGCDVCQEVCPWNRHAPQSGWPEFLPNPEFEAITPSIVGRMSDPEFASAFAGSPLLRPGLDGLKRTLAALPSPQPSPQRGEGEMR